jgi:hypothetical protein
MQHAAKDLAQDIQNAIGGAPSGKVGGHHHHHHHHQPVETASSFGDATSNLAVTASAGDGDGDKNDQGAATTGQSSDSAMSSVLKNAREA